MQSCFKIGTICALSTIISAVGSDLISPLTDDWIVQDANNLPLDQTEPSSFHQPASLFDLGKLPEDSNFGVSSASEPLFQDTNNNDNLFSENDDEFLVSSLLDDHNGNVNDNSAVFDGNPSEIASCLSSSSTLEDFPPVIGKKLRLKRQSCKNPNEATGSFSTSSGSGDGELDLSVPKALFTDPTAILLLTGAMTDDRRNRFCQWFTQGLKPFGVCTIRDFPDETMSILGVLSFPPFGLFGLWTLPHCTLGKCHSTTSCVLFNMSTFLILIHSFALVTHWMTG